MMLSTSTPISSFSGYERFWNPLLDTTPTSPPKDAFAKMPDPAQLRAVYGELRSFVKRRNSKGLPSSVRLYTHAVANKGAGMQTGIFATGRRSTNKYFWAVVVGLWPIHWVLVLDGELDEDLLEVTDWATLDYKDKKTQKVQIPCNWMVGKYPLDFRSPEVIKRTRFTATMRLEGLIPEPGMDKEQLFQAAISFARRRAKWTREGFLMTEFKSGTYFEVEGHQGWLPGVTRDEAREFFKTQLAKESNPNLENAS